MSKSVHPVVGNVATVQIRNTSAMDCSIFPNRPSTLTFTGTVLESTAFDPPESMRLSGDVLMPVRVISFSQVVAFDGQVVTHTPLEKPKEIVKVVPGSKGAEYVVTVNAAGKASCTCTGFGFRRTCKHCDGVLESLQNSTKED